MKHQIFIALALFGFAACGRLDNAQYLPPNQRAGVSAGRYSGPESGQYSSSGAGEYSGGQSPAQQVPILKLENNNDGDGTYSYTYETGDGIQAQEQGSLNNDAQSSQGGFSYTAPDGQQIQVSYVADENGFQPQGVHLPTAPPVPEEILKALEQNAQDEANGIFDDGQYKPEPQQQYGVPQQQYKAGGTGRPQQEYGPPTSSQLGSQGGYKY